MDKYDFVVIGAGGTGLAGAMYGARLNMKTLVLGTTYGAELPIGGVITTTSYVENYPGFKKILGMDLAKNLEEHARAYDLVTIKNEKVTEIKSQGKVFLLKTDKGDYEAKSLLFATGTKWRKLEAPGALEFENKGVNYCALCDGPLFKDKVVGIVGGSDSAGKDALILAEHAKKVYIIYRGDEIHPELVTYEDIKKK